MILLYTEDQEPLPAACVPCSSPPSSFPAEVALDFRTDWVGQGKAEVQDPWI